MTQQQAAVVANSIQRAARATDRTWQTLANIKQAIESIGLTPDEHEQAVKRIAETLRL